METLLFILYPLALIRPRLVLAALGLHSALLAQTAQSYGRIPLMGMRDTLGFLAFTIGVSYLVVAWRRKRDLFTYLTIPLILFLLLAGSQSQPIPPGPLPPV